MTSKISIIIPAYNVENQIKKCLDSLLKQSLPDYEIICVDDASIDATFGILKEYSKVHSNITCIRNMENKGAAFSRNRGLELAKGEYVIFLDSDDTFHPQLLEKLHTAIKRENADVAVCNAYYYDKNGRIIQQGGWNKELIKTNVLHEHDNREHIFSGILLAPWNKLVRRKLLMDHEIRFQNLKASNDVFYSMMVAACAKKIVLIPDVLVYYLRERTGNITQYKRQKRDYFIQAYEAAIKELKEKGLWEKDIQKAGITSIVRRCYLLVSSSEGELERYYSDEWTKRIVPVLQREEVEQIGDRWLYYQYMYLSERNEITVLDNVYQMFAEEIGKYLKKYENEKIALWGAGKLGQQFLSAVPEAKQLIDYIVDNDVNKQGKNLCGVKIYSFDSIKNETDRYVVLNERYLEDIKKQVGVETKLINMKQVMEAWNQMV